MIFSTVPGRVTEGFATSGLSFLSVVKRLHSSPAPKARTSEPNQLRFLKYSIYRDTDLTLKRVRRCQACSRIVSGRSISHDFTPSLYREKIAGWGILANLRTLAYVHGARRKTHATHSKAEASPKAASKSRKLLPLDPTSRILRGMISNVHHREFLV